MPSWDVEDIRALYTEETIKVATPLELYNRMQRVVPSESDIVVKADDGFMKLKSFELWQSLPFFSWEEIFNFAGVPMPEKKPSKENRKSRQ